MVRDTRLNPFMRIFRGLPQALKAFFIKNSRQVIEFKMIFS